MSPRGPLCTVSFYTTNTQFGENTEKENFVSVSELCCYQLTNMTF